VAENRPRPVGGADGKRVIERWDRVFEAVSAEPRRRVLVSLMDAGAADAVPVPESAIDPNVPADPERLRVQLYHEHLPMLAEREFVEWKTEPLRASRGPRFDEVRVVFDALHS
jgi:hypothetical protein